MIEADTQEVEFTLTAVLAYDYHPAAIYPLGRLTISDGYQNLDVYL
jgi:hypothetical protein